MTITASSSYDLSTETALRGSGDLGLAIVVRPDLPAGLLANTVATIAAGLGAVHPGVGNVPLQDKQGITIMNSADRPIPILQATSNQIFALLEKAQAKKPGLTLVAFPEYARRLHSFADYETVFAEHALAEEQLSGLGFCGGIKAVRSLTGSLKLLR